MTEVSSKSPDILYVIGSLGVGGAERQLSFVARSLAGRGMHIAIYSLAGDGPLGSELEEGGVTVLVPPVSRAGIGNSPVLRALRLVLAAIHLTSVMVRTRPKAAHFFLPSAYLIGGFCAVVAGIKVRVMSRRSMNLYQLSYPAVRWIEMKLHRRMSAVLGNSLAVIHQLRDEEGVHAERLGLIYNGVRISQGVRSRAEVRASLGLDEETLVFIIVANLIPYKGHLDLIKAFALAKERIGEPWRLLVVGRDDGIESELRSVSERLNLDKNILFLGLRSDADSLMAASDIGLLSSHEEGFSNTILEGMVARLPMIVTDVGGNAEAVVDGETGTVVPPRDPQAFAEAIVDLACDPEKRCRYGAAGLKRIEARFRSDGCVARYEALYSGLRQGKLPRDIPEVACKTA